MSRVLPMAQVKLSAPSESLGDRRSLKVRFTLSLKNLFIKYGTLCTSRQNTGVASEVMRLVRQAHASDKCMCSVGSKLNLCNVVVNCFNLVAATCSVFHKIANRPRFSLANTLETQHINGVKQTQHIRTLVVATSLRLDSATDC